MDNFSAMMLALIACFILYFLTDIQIIFMKKELKKLHKKMDEFEQRTMRKWLDDLAEGKDDDH
jgi:uncharacterized membrane protein